MQIVTIGNDLAGIEPPKSFRNAEDSVPYGALKENDKLQFVCCKSAILELWHDVLGLWTNAEK